MLTQIETDDEIYHFFVQETLEFLQSLEKGLLTLRQEHSTNKIHSLMRAAHSIKGGAGCVGLTGIQTIAHQLENGFRALYREDVEFDRELEELLLQAYDTLRSPLMDQIKTGKCKTDTALKKIKLISTQLEAKLGHSLEEETQVPEVEMNVDITQFLFTQEVAQGLTRWETLLTNPTSKLVEELKAQAEVFVSFGELLNLPGFVAIAKTTISALQANPSQVKTIGQLAASDFRVSQAAVLKGDRSTGGSPSTQLVNLAQLPKPKAKNTNGNPSITPMPNSSLLEDLDKTSSQLQKPLSAQAPTSSLLEDLEKTSSQVLTPPKASVAESSLLEDLANGFSSSKKAKSQISDLQLSTESKKVKSEISNIKSPVIKAELKEENKNGFHHNGKSKIPVVEQPTAAVKTNVSYEPTAVDLVWETTQPTQDPAGNEQNAKLGVRVDLERLELLNNLVGDLVTQENSFFLQYQQHKEILDAIAQRLNRFNKLTRNYLGRGAEGQRGRGAEGQRGRGAEGKERSQITNSQLPIPLEQTVEEEIAQLQEALQDMALTQQQVQQIIKKRQQTLNQLQTNLLNARMLPLENLLNRFPRMIRDFATKNHKQVNLQMIGMSTLIDKAILEKLYDPLIHLVRNAFDHGIETPQVREAQGKSPTGTITISAYHRGSNTYIEVQDDGQGIDPKKISRRAVAMNLLSPSEASILPKNRLYKYLFAPGFSTADRVSELSGRGVGLEAARLQLGALKGSIGVTSEPGKGSTFILRLPFTLTITKLLIFSVNANLLAIPVDALMAIAAAPEDRIETHQGQEFYSWQGRLIPVYSYTLLSSYNYPQTPPASDQLRGSYLWQKSGKIPLLLLSHRSQAIALKIDQILMEQNLAIKPFGEAMTAPPYFYGCTILGDGRLVPAIDGSQLAAWLLQQKSAQNTVVSTLPISHNFKSVSSSSMPAVLTIDDSVTMRKSLSLTLSKEGYQVLQARNGWEAIELLRQEPKIKAIICDIEMPQMNGFEFLSRCRKEFSVRALPVIMLTSRSSERYRLLAKQLGAIAYLTKPYLDKQLLNTLKLCLEGTLVPS
ncbi:hybrid sensor histidine kinase/response regulator [Argonema galeatum]|uniref:hybrid sensor histidine kinase/response regulator n=1 Tax=Argonema galeatum TaxID=2942762 RepID=UPI00201242D6|nr:hybrid sensor histidine kinase/response regulator [Argonema galeatum]MCL1469012.1 hybrid sensor histidine kinase/response regulator [Argonema galeatum A003/A1]